MNKIPLVAGLFLFIILFASITFVQAESLTPTPSPTAMPTHVDYALPYPGLLPGNPLYFLKVARDKIVGFFISDPLKKAQFDLLMADKRINTGVYLARGKENDDRDDRISDVVSKGENYFAEGIENIRKAQAMNEVTSPILGTMQTSLEKHEEVIGELEQEVGPSAKQKLAGEATRVQEYSREVSSLIKH